MWFISPSLEGKRLNYCPDKGSTLKISAFEPITVAPTFIHSVDNSFVTNVSCNIVTVRCA